MLVTWVLCDLFLDFSTLVWRHRVNTPTDNHCTAFNTAELTLQTLLCQERFHTNEVSRSLPTSKCMDNLKGVFQSGFKWQMGQHVSCHRHFLQGSGTCLSLLISVLVWQNNRKVFILFLCCFMLCYVGLLFGVFRWGIFSMFSKPTLSRIRQKPTGADTSIPNMVGSCLTPLPVLAEQGFFWELSLISATKREGLTHVSEVCPH